MSPPLPICTLPPLTVNPLSAPPAEKIGEPLVSTARGALIKPHPLQVIPHGLATTTSACLPATSM